MFSRRLNTSGIPASDQRAEKKFRALKQIKRARAVVPTA